MRSASSKPRNTVALFAGVSRKSERVIVPLNDSALNLNASRPALYCVHSISGTVRTDLIDLAHQLEPVRFYGIQAPPKLIQDVEFGETVESVADYYADALMNFQPRGLLILGGYCAGAVIALEMANNLRARGRDVGFFFAIDGAPENTGGAISHWRPRYWLELARNLPGWFAHSDLMRNASLKAWVHSVAKNLAGIARGAMGLNQGEKLGGGYTMDALMDLTPYPPAHRAFINRLFSALFRYFPKTYERDVVVYEAAITSLLYSPQYGRAWRMVAPQSEIVRITGTHIAMMHAPYVDELANHMRMRIERVSSRISERGLHPVESSPGNEPFSQ